MTYNQRLSPHRGADIANDTGTPVLAVGPGIVLYAGAGIEKSCQRYNGDK